MSFQRTQYCPVPTPKKLDDSRNFDQRVKSLVYVVANIVALFYIIVIFMWNFRTIYPDTYIPAAIDGNARFMKVDQWWALFAPYPLKEDGWYVVVGEYSKKGEVDLFQNKETVSFDKPENVAHTYKNQRWRKYMMNLWGKDYSNYRAGYLSYMCRENKNKYKDDTLTKIRMYFVLEKTLPDYRVSPTSTVFLEEQTCY